MSSDKLTLDDVLRLADEHAEESYENGDRRFDRGGLYQFAKELLTAHEAEKQDNCQGCQTPRACEYHGCKGESEKQAGPVACISIRPDAKPPHRPDDFCPDKRCGIIGQCFRAMSNAAPPSESDKEDAENYRWLANNCDGDAQDDFIQMIARNVLSRAEFDAAIRAARAKKGKP